MVIPENIRKCVVFLGMQMADGSYRFAGTAFFLGDPNRQDTLRLVTAKHIIQGIRNRGLNEVYIRANFKDGTSKWFSSHINAWLSHPFNDSIDIAIYTCGMPEVFDHIGMSIEYLLTDEIIKQNEVGLGDEVFITGLFSHHHGTKKNIPIVRVGNIAGLLEEKIVTKDFGEIDGYLIEARSIGGLSGSPVFLNLGTFRHIGGKMYRAPGELFFPLLGLIHGHFDASELAIDDVEGVGPKSGRPEKVNTGIAVVVPFFHIRDMFEYALGGPPV